MNLITSSVVKIVGSVGTIITKGFSLTGQGIKAAAPEAVNLIKVQLVQGWHVLTPLSY